GLQQYVSIDVGTGRVTPLIDAPIADSLAEKGDPGASWSATGAKALLLYTYVPGRRHPCLAVVVDMASGSNGCVAESPGDYVEGSPAYANHKYLLEGSFGRSDDEVVLRTTREFQQYYDQTYRFESGVWRFVGVKAVTSFATLPNRAPLSIALRQGPNTPPSLWATDRASGAGKQIWDPNPQLANVAIGRESILRWKDSIGYEWVSGLILPPNYVASKRYPLVIQTHGFDNPDTFLTDGAGTTAFAARPLASAGFVVLQMPEGGAHFGTIKEPADQLRGYQSAVALLDKKGLIDPYRVGIIGWSRTCWHVESALIADPRLFAAASINDGIDDS